MIQLKTIEEEILYELPKSDLFQNYRSVLIEAIAHGINLKNLSVVSENINNVD
ncbi:hypothetical protein C7377_1521 [Balneicella halophila]|uniref:Uncharacterized protein n=2 Tax=Balneicella halophila TaxID=1537566 RepID=A0A7L4UP90_BALHA|nr:hypothetical protein C7377_1521 [Balneicella halophila]